MEDPNFQALFESSPSLYLVLTPDLKIVAASDTYLKATLTQRESILGRDVFDVFPDNPDEPQATGSTDVRASFQRVLTNKTIDKVSVQRYPIRRPKSEGGGFEERYWSPVNTPVFKDKTREVIYILHRVEDVTEIVRLRQRDEEQKKLTTEQKELKK